MFENMTFARAHLALRSATQRWGEPLPEEVPTSTAPTFHLFARLPYEIRTQIWLFSISSSTPRVIELRQSPKFGRVTRYSPTTRVGSDTKPPAVLSVCRESREIAKGYYILHNKHINVFLNPDVDTLYIGEHTTSHCLRDLVLYSPREELSRVKRLVVLRDKLHKLIERAVGFDDPNDVGVSMFHCFPGLEELFVTYADLFLCPCHEYAPSNDVCMRCRLKGRRINDELFGWRLPTFRGFIEVGPEHRYGYANYEDLLRAPRKYLLRNRTYTDPWRARRPRYVWDKKRKVCVFVYD